MSIPALSSKLRSNFKIGVFDSGVGGLTVLKELTAQMPHESFVYFGDTARVPYGNRSKSEILRFVREIIAWMVEQDVKMIIMACNTSSALVLEEVRSEFQIPILGIILPGARAAVKSGKRIGVVSTQATAESDAYRQAVLEIDHTAKVWQVGCQDFVPLIESDRIHDPYTRSVAKRYLEPLLADGIDTLVYGCTHYPHLAPVFKQILPNAIKLVDPAKYLTVAAMQELKILRLRHSKTTHVRRQTLSQSTTFYVSGDPQQFAQVSTQWLGFMPDVQKVAVETLEAIQSSSASVNITTRTEPAQQTVG